MLAQVNIDDFNISKSCVKGKIVKKISFKTLEIIKFTRHNLFRFMWTRENKNVEIYNTSSHL